MAVTVGAFASWFAYWTYQGSFTGPRGEQVVTGLSGRVEVRRDPRTGTSYIRAGSLEDAYFAQGYTAAFDRMLQMLSFRAVTEGRLTELLIAEPSAQQKSLCRQNEAACKPVAEFEGALASDKVIRTIGVRRLARQHAAVLDAPSRALFQAYADGVNALLFGERDYRQLEMRIKGIRFDRPWSIEDSIAIIYLQGWLGARLQVQLEALNISVAEQVGGPRSAKLFPLPVAPTPGDPCRTVPLGLAPVKLAERPATHRSGRASSAPGQGAVEDVGSNAWAVAAGRTANNATMLAADPHLAPNRLPGWWHPVVMVTDEHRLVGATLAGLPGIAIGRSDSVAFAPTRGFDDRVDLYREVDGPHVISTTEVIRIKNGEVNGGFREVPLQIRRTERGPIVSGLFAGLDANSLYSLRWAAAERRNASLGIERFAEARSAQDFVEVLQDATPLALAMVFVDNESIGSAVTGAAPVRAGRTGHVPSAEPVDPRTWEDDWIAWRENVDAGPILNPRTGLVVRANNLPEAAHAGPYHSGLFAPGLRKARVDEMVGSRTDLTVADFWEMQRDTKNLLAACVAPTLTEALDSDPRTSALASLLRTWDLHDRAESAAPLAFHALVTALMLEWLSDDLDEATMTRVLGQPYYWLGRLQRMLGPDADAQWFDDRRTVDHVETRRDLIVRAGLAVLEDLDAPPEFSGARYGDHHTLTFTSPAVKNRTLARWLGFGPFEVSGSGQTVYRMGFPRIRGQAQALEVNHAATMRLVVDMSDTDKVVAVFTGGVVGRALHRHFIDRVPAYLSGEQEFLWMSDQAIASNTIHSLSLVPARQVE